MQKLGKILVISADHLGDCLLGGSFDRETKALTVEHLRQNLTTRAAISTAATEVLTALTTDWGQPNEVIFKVVENEELAGYLGKNCTGRATSAAIRPADIPQLLYRTRCALDEGSLLFAEGINPDLVEMALAEEREVDRLVGHLIRSLALACDIAATPMAQIEFRSEKRHNDLSSFLGILRGDNSGYMAGL